MTNMETPMKLQYVVVAGMAAIGPFETKWEAREYWLEHNKDIPTKPAFLVLLPPFTSEQYSEAISMIQVSQMEKFI